jgi:hypothetical protein
METSVMFLDCPEYLGKQGVTRCGLPAEVLDRYAAESTDGPLESARIRCPRGHWFNGPVDMLLVHENQVAGAHPPAPRPRTSPWLTGPAGPVSPRGQSGSDG